MLPEEQWVQTWKKQLFTENAVIKNLMRHIQLTAWAPFNYQFVKPAGYLTITDN